MITTTDIKIWYELIQAPRLVHNYIRGADKYSGNAALMCL